MKKLIWANFKLNMSTRKEHEAYNEQIASYLSTHSESVETVFFPQIAQLGILHEQYSDITYWAQTLANKVSWAFTGELSITTIKDLGINWVMIGHSERRQYYWETDESVHEKLVLALDHDMKIILCVGETLDQRKNWQTLDILSSQLNIALQWLDSSKIDIAYEPVWAIGTGLTPTVQDIAEAHLHIRNMIKNTESRILYGGSSNDTNAQEFSEIPHVNGFLVGWAALDPNKFGKMITILAG